MTVIGLGHRTSWSAADFYDQARAVAGALRRRGAGPGSRIGILSANRMEWVLLDLAALMIKAQTAGFEPGKFTPDADLVERYDLDLLFTDVPLPDDAPPQAVPISIVADHAGEVPADLDPVQWATTDCTTVKFTSGSTGVPKGLEATAGSIDSSLHAVQGLFGHGPGDDILTFLPLSILQQRYWLYSALYWGHDLTITTYQSVLAVMSTVRPTVVMGVPAFFDAVRRHIENSVADGAEPAEAVAEVFGDRIRYLWTGSAPADRAMLDFYGRAGLEIYEGYGLNETCIVTKNYPGATREGSVGRALPGKEIIIDDDGVVHVRSDFPVNTRYTFAAPGSSENIFGPGGLVRTGDLGRLDDDGFLYILGRADDVLVLGNGKKIIVRPVETRFRDTGAVSDCVLYHPSSAGLVAVVSPLPGPVDTGAVSVALADVNAVSEPDERIVRVIVADEPFTVENGLLTSQFKPVRHRIAHRYSNRIDDPKAGIRAY
ncbi:AMP-binding protein [Kineosporia sp. NBRC 101731]|uniref:AMP-binding protein n=1 Tax=Kineosporia sp. NBRC 101731 TaxID=3032199 RepID=UPI003325B465